MKSLATAIALFSTIALFGDGKTFITNKSSEKVLVEWQTALSETTKSPVGRSVAQPHTKDVESKEGVDWFDDHTKESPNALIYMIEVRVYDPTGTHLLSEKAFKKSLSKEKLQGEKPQNSLYISVGSSFTPSIHIKK